MVSFIRKLSFICSKFSYVSYSYMSTTTHRIAELANSHCLVDGYTNVTVSIGCGNCDMEIESSSLCICLDVNKRSLFCANLRLSLKKKSNVIVRYFNWKDDLLDLLYHLSSYKLPDINVLIQHPSPNKCLDYRESFAECGMNCLLSLKLGRINSIHLIYDYIDGKHCWSRDSIEYWFTKYWGEETIVTVTKISDASNDIVNHPIFGVCSRIGWSHHKSKSDIYCMKIGITT